MLRAATDVLCFSSREAALRGRPVHFANPVGLLRDAAKPRLAGSACGGGDGAAHGSTLRTALRLAGMLQRAQNPASLAPPPHPSKTDL